LAVLQQASLYHGNDRELASEYGRLALEFDQVNLAKRLLAIADDPANPDWRVISAQGTVLAKQGDYKGAIPYYERALRLAPDQPSVINNLAMAHAAEGQPAKAEPLLRRAVASGSAPAKVHQNLALVLSLQGRHDEARQLAQSSPVGDAAASDVDYLRRMVRIEQKAAGPALAADRPASGLRAAAAESQDSGGGSIDWDTRVAAASPALALKQSQR
jgi:Flp pilus assembly protein TadD